MDKLKYFFENREDALKQLIEAMDQVDFKETLIVAISPDGAVLADGVAKHFGLELEYLFLAPIKAPKNPDCVIALVSELKDVVIDESLIDAFGIASNYVYDQAKIIHDQEIVSYLQRFRGEKPLQSFCGKDILIVDEGIETGFSAEVAIKACISNKCKTVSLATPVLSQDIQNYLLKFCDCVYSVLSPNYFVSTSYYYKNLPAFELDEVMRYFVGSNLEIQGEKND